MISLQDVCKSYVLGEVPIHVLQRVSLNIDQGEFVAIMGPSGSGKSTLLNIIGCLDMFDSGTYHLGGIPIAGASEDELAQIRSKRLGFVFQSFSLIPRIDALRNVALPMIYSGVPPKERMERARQMLMRVGLAERAQHSPAQLSGGQQQRTAIARALVNNPDVLIADEPTGSLDSRTSEEIMQLFVELNRAGITIVMVTHEEDIARYARRIIRLRDGRIEQDAKNDVCYQ